MSNRIGTFFFQSLAELSAADQSQGVNVGDLGFVFDERAIFVNVDNATPQWSSFNPLVASRNTPIENALRMRTFRDPSVRISPSGSVTLETIASSSEVSASRIIKVGLRGSFLDNSNGTNAKTFVLDQDFFLSVSGTGVARPTELTPLLSNEVNVGLPAFDSLVLEIVFLGTTLVLRIRNQSVVDSFDVSVSAYYDIQLG